MTNKTRKWIRSMMEILIHGGCAAIISSITAATVDNVQFALFSHGFWKMLAASFTANGALRFFQFWQANPLPPESDSTPPFAGIEQLKISLNPIAKVQPLIPAASITPPETKS